MIILRKRKLNPVYPTAIPAKAGIRGAATPYFPLRFDLKLSMDAKSSSA